MNNGRSNRILNLICVLYRPVLIYKCYLKNNTRLALAITFLCFSQNGSLVCDLVVNKISVKMAFFRGNSCLKHFQILCRSDKRNMRNLSVTQKPVLYGDEASPPVRFAMMIASLLNIDLEFHSIDLFKAENRTEFYKTINPLQKVPALSVNGDVICDSHAIALYFCRNSKQTELYPEEIMLRTKIDEWLYFDSGVLFPIDSALFSNFFAGQCLDNDVRINHWYSSLDHLELKLSNQKWLTGDKMRLCDVCCGTTVSSVEILVPLLEQHVYVKEWLRSLNTLSCFEINKRGLKRLQSFVEILKQRE